jgi:hypothetical protein
MDKIHWQGVVLGIIIGVIAAPQIAKLPLVNKLPTV